MTRAIKPKPVGTVSHRGYRLSVRQRVKKEKKSRKSKAIISNALPTELGSIVDMEMFSLETIVVLAGRECLDLLEVVIELARYRCSASR